MPRTPATTSRKRAIREPIPAPAPSRSIVQQAALLLTLLLVIVRMTMTETFRLEGPALPGASAGPSVPGPATGMVLDLLCCLPALLVIAARVHDSWFVPRRAWSHLPMLLLGAWSMCSILWASDKFAALVSASHWLAALVLLWSTSQLVREWVRLRLIAAVGFGLLLVLLVQGYYYRFVDLPDFQQQWREHREQLLGERGASADSIEAIQLGKNIESGDVTGFNVSRNTYAAVLVLLIIVAAGIVMQRWADGDGLAWSAPVTAGTALGLVMLYGFVHSKTAYVTPLGAALLLLAIAWKRRWLTRYSRAAYFGALAAFVLIFAAVVGHGLHHSTLFHVSLTFRWQYWVGAARVFAHHWLLGVGWANFGPFYLIYRLPQAAEEPMDPHNFLVRCFVELGIVGGTLVFLWMPRLWWELTQSSLSGAPPARAEGASSSARPFARRSALPLIVGLAIGGILLNAAISIDWEQTTSWLILESFKRVLFALALLLGILIVAIRSFEKQEFDDRPAPWLLHALLTGLALFLFHNLIDVSMFETGPMFLFALLTGGALGIRMRDPAAHSLGRGASAAGLAIGVAAWMAAAIAGVLPVVEAEARARQADLEIRAGRVDAGRMLLVDAFHQLPLNADYAYRGEQAALLGGADAARTRELIDLAIAENPVSAKYRQARALLDVASGDFDAAWSDYHTALALDPANLQTRIEFAEQLGMHGRATEARAQYQQVLRYNSMLAADEIKRLGPMRIRQIDREIDKLGPA